MREIGGYIELDKNSGVMFHDEAIKLNCGRNALEYVIKANNIRKILMPYFMCDSCDDVLERNKVQVAYYSIGKDFKPIINVMSDDWLYVVNYYGQLSNEYIESLGSRVIVDNTQAYFQITIEGKNTLYSCRKYFGVSDGAILYTDNHIDVCEQDESFNRMHYILGRFERNANEFYSEYITNNNYFKTEPIKKMSKLTKNILTGLDYKKIRDIRTENFSYLDKYLSKTNMLTLSIPLGPFMYPYYVKNGELIRKRLIENHIYIPMLWPSVLERCNPNQLEYDMALNILPLPIDQRYNIEDMKTIIKTIENYRYNQ